MMTVNEFPWVEVITKVPEHLKLWDSEKNGQIISTPRRASSGPVGASPFCLCTLEPS